jgi:serine/threonine-protein kinase RsbT
MEQALAILTRYVSPPTARSILGLAEQRVGATGTSDLRHLLDSIEHSLRLFVTDPVQVRKCRASLEELSDNLPRTHDSVVVPIGSEDDIVKARMEARRVAVQIGFSTVGVTRLMTAVSEVARNIVLYAGQGQIEVVPTNAPRGIEITARDRGPGIRNLDQILAGNYKSRLGMGLGLRGVKKLADRFDVQTAIGAGTTVRFSLRVA